MTADGQSGVLEAPPAGPPVGVAVDVVIVAYNSREVLRDCVGPLLRLPWVSITVVDNASPDDSAAVVADLPVRVIKAPRNGGFAYGCNLGSAAGDAEFVMFLNPDARIEPESLRTLVDLLRAHPVLGERGTADARRGRTAPPNPASVPATSLNLRAGAGVAPSRGVLELGRRSHPGSGRVRTPGHAGLALRVMHIDAALGAGRGGGLDEGFFLYSEETDLFRRLRHRGWGVRFEPNATAFHQGYGSAPWDTVTPVLAGSRVRYARKHHGRLVAVLEAIGVTIDSLVRAAAWVHRPTRRRGHLAAARAALSSLRPPSRCE